jgi:hypothetical protein
MPTSNATRRGNPGVALNMIIVSGSSAKATQPVRTGRYTPAHRPSSAARSDTHRYANARRIRVHTEEVTGSIPVSPTVFMQFKGRIPRVGIRPFDCFTVV